jgi:hypothetical protein
MDAIQLTHVQLSKVEPGSLVLVGATDADDEQYFAIAVHRAGEPSAPRLVSFRGDRGALRAVRTEFSATEAPERFVLSLGRQFSIEPNLLEPVQTERVQSALMAGDLLIHDAQQLLVVESAKGAPPLVVDLAAGEVSELSAAPVAVVTHWNIYICNADGQRTCVVDTKSHKSTAATATASFPLQRTG